MKPYGTTIFCDDIRDEVTGKKTYVGVYSTDMVIDGDLPVIIPQFALAITYLEPLNSTVKPVTLKVLVPSTSDDDELAIEVDLPVDRVNAMKQSEQDPMALYRAHLLSFKVSPFVVQKEGYVKVRAYIDDEEVRLGSLKVRQRRDGEQVGIRLSPIE